MTATTAARQIEEIRDEWRRRKSENGDSVMDRIAAGQMSDAASQILFRVDPGQRQAIIESLVRDLPDRYAVAGDELRRGMLRFCVDMALDLGSFVPSWRSRDPEPETKLARMMLALVERLSAAGEEEARELHATLRSYTLSRLEAEAVTDRGQAEEIAAAELGADLVQYIQGMWRQYAASNMRRAAQMYLEGATATALGNDYAAFLDHAMRVGASSQTTNPVLIKLAWDTDRPGWDERIDRIISAAYDRETIGRTLAGSESERDALVRHINTLVTTAVVERNCRALRDIFLMTEGREGYLNLQVSPENYADGRAMVSQAVAVYQDLQQRLGGVPNVVIKVPATPAGRDAAFELTQLGIGVTVTLTFSMFQACPVAEAIRDANALVSNIAVMNGRLAFPVRDELESAGVNGGAEAARWAGVEVARKIYRRLYDGEERGGMGMDPNRVRLLIASLRIYDDWLPDLSELWGVPAITIFPNVRRTFDAHPRRIDGGTVENSTPPDAVETMLQSELFRQAWWTEQDGSHGRPARPLSMAASDADAVAIWVPVKQTLEQFIDGYKTMNGMILERLDRIGGNKP